MGSGVVRRSTTGEHACVNVSDDAAQMGRQVDTFDIIRGMARAYMKPKYVYSHMVAMQLHHCIIGNFSLWG